MEILYSIFNSIHIPCNRLTIQWLIQNNCTCDHKQLSLSDIPPTWCYLHNPYRRRSFTQEYGYSKCRPISEYTEVKYYVIDYNFAKTLKTRINYMYFTFLKNSIFRCRPTYRCDYCHAVTTFTQWYRSRTAGRHVRYKRRAVTYFYLQIPLVSILTNMFHIQNPYLLPTTSSHRYAAYDCQVRLG